MKYMLDTSICVHTIRRKSGTVVCRLKRERPEDVGVSAITVSELEYGVAKSAHRDRNAIALAEFLAPLEVAHFDEEAARHYGEIRAELESRGSCVGAMDMLIAAHARALGATVVTNNTREFRRVTGLAVEDWTR